MKVTHTIIVISLLLSSCGSNIDDSVSMNEYCYSNGTVITDSSLIKLLSEEANSLGIDQQGSKKIYSTLNALPNLELFTDSLCKLYLQSIKANDPDESFIVDTIDQSILFDAGCVVYDNATGNTIYRYEPKMKHHTLESMMGYGKSSRFLGFFLTMDKGNSIDDEYQAFTKWDDSIEIYNEKNEIVDHWYNDGKRPLKELFYLESGGEIPKFPYQQYRNNDWSDLESKLKINIKSECLPSPHGCLIESNFIDLVESFMLVRNLGLKKNTSLISKIVDSSGKIIYQKKSQSETSVSRSTIDKMKQLLEYNMVNGLGQFFKKELSLDGNCYVYWGRNQRDIGWVLYSDKNVTAGIIIKGRDRLGYNGMMHYLSPHYTQKSPRILLPILKKVLADSK